MQAILTKYLTYTNFRRTRIKASCKRGSIIIPADSSTDFAHIAAADALVAKFVEEDGYRYREERNPWTKPRVCGCITTGVWAHVFLEEDRERVALEACFEAAAELCTMPLIQIDRATLQHMVNGVRESRKEKGV